MAHRINQTAFDLIAGTADDPALFFYAALKSPKLRRWQLDVCSQIHDQLARGKRHIRVLCRTCHGAGKTFLAAGLGVWWISTRPDSRGLTTAPTWAGVENLLWPEIARLYNGSRLRDVGFGRLLNTEFIVSQDRAGKPTWYLTGGSSDKPEKLEGHHSQRAAVRIVDEAKTVEHGVFVSTVGMLDAPETFDLWISTPSIRLGDFYDRDAKDTDPDLIRAVVTIEDLIAEGIPGKKEWKQKALIDYGGENSFEYRARAMAEYIDNAEGALYPFSWIERAMLSDQKRADRGLPVWHVETRPFVGYDVAGSVDGDENATAPVHGPDNFSRFEIGPLRSWKEQDTQISKDNAMEFARSVRAAGIRGDVQGLGKGVIDSMRREVDDRRLSLIIDEYRAADAAKDPERFQNRKAEDSWDFRAALEADRVRLPDSQILKEQMAGTKYEVRNGKIRIVDPKDSPDHLDAIITGLGDAAPETGAVAAEPGKKGVFVEDLPQTEGAVFG